MLSVLMATGWAANHFSAVIPTLQEREGLSSVLLDGVFGVYAVGLLPGLFGGGALSDRVGRRLVVLPGSLIATAGSLVLLLDHGPGGLVVGRLVVGLGAGLTFGAGTAWAADVGGAAGTVLAGVFLTSGFGLGPLVSGLLAQYVAAPLRLPFVVSIVLSLAATAAAALVPDPRRAGDLDVRVPAAGPVGAHVRSGRLALGWSLPVAVLVFGSGAMAIVTLPTRLPDEYDGPLLVGIACALTLFTGIGAQTLARSRGWGPFAGVAGAMFSALGFVLSAIGGAGVGLPLFAVACVSLGLGYGLCLREGLLDVETLAPANRRGLLTGIFYVATYLGFGLPVLLVAIRPTVGITAPVLAAGALGLVVAATRALQLRGGHPAR